MSVPDAGGAGGNLDMLSMVGHMPSFEVGNEVTESNPCCPYSMGAMQKGRRSGRPIVQLFCVRRSRCLAIALAIDCTTCTSRIMMITAVQVTVWSNFW